MKRRGAPWTWKRRIERRSSFHTRRNKQVKAELGSKLRDLEPIYHFSVTPRRTQQHGFDNQFLPRQFAASKSLLDCLAETRCICLPASLCGRLVA